MSSVSNVARFESTDLTDQRSALYGGVTLAGWISIGIVTVLMIATFRYNLARLWSKTNPFTGEPEWQHSVLVPIVGLYYLFLHREELLRTPLQPVLLVGFDRARVWGAAGTLLGALFVGLVGPVMVSSQAELMHTGGYLLAALAGLVLAINWGLATTVFGLLFFAYGIWPGQNDYFKDLGMVCTVFGVVLTLCGWKVMRIAWFPIVFLVFALPWPGLVYSRVAGPLQVLAAQVAVGVLKLAGIDAFQFGTKINTGSRVLNVAEACAGLKSLMTFMTLGASMAFLTTRPMWQRFLIVFAAIPIAIFCNVMRVSGQGLLDHFGGAQWSEGFAHQFVGMVMLAPAFLLLLLLMWILDRLFVEDADDVEMPAAILAARKAQTGKGAVASADVVAAPTIAVPRAVAAPAGRNAAQPISTSADRPAGRREFTPPSASNTPNSSERSNS